MGSVYSNFIKQQICKSLGILGLLKEWKKKKKNLSVVEIC